MADVQDIIDYINLHIEDNTTGAITPLEVRTALLMLAQKLGEAGIPEGGANGYVLAKQSSDDYDVDWVAAGSGGGSTTFTATVGHSATDPFVDTSTAPTFTTLRSVTPDNGDDIAIQLNDFPFEYFIMEYDATEPDITAFFDTVLHSGAIPDGFEWRPIFTVSGKKYLLTYNQAAFDGSPATVSFTH